MVGALERLDDRIDQGFSGIPVSRSTSRRSSTSAGSSFL
jgi:hypothetical protein